MRLKNKRVLLGVAGGIAAYKAASLIRLLCEAGAEVQVVMTESAKAFITPLTLQCLSGHPVRSALFDCVDEHAMGHISLARWPDSIVIAPATADCMAKLAHGFAGDLLSTLCLATEAPIALVPAMNQQMWANPATQDNCSILKQRGMDIWGPDSGEQACGEVGVGRMLEPEQIMTLLGKSFGQHSYDKQITRVLITAGPTYEPIDPVRFLGNRSSGKMGYALAQAWIEVGAQVTLISGPVALDTPENAEVVYVQTAEDMAREVMAQVEECDVFIGTAAVADFHVEDVATQKIKKSAEGVTLALSPNRDIIREVAALPTRPFVVGFAAETENVLVNAREKLHGKQLDMIVANQVGEGLGFGEDDLEVMVLRPNEDPVLLPQQSKKNLAKALVVDIQKQLVLLQAKVVKEAV